MDWNSSSNNTYFWSCLHPWMYKRVMFGELNTQFNSGFKIKDVYFYEIVIFSILTFIILVMGIKPNFITTLLEGSIYQITSVLVIIKNDRII